MSKSYTPGLKVLERVSVVKERILPLLGEVHVNKDDKVEADRIIASTKIPGNVQMINVANELNIDPDQVPSCMLCKIDEKVSKGQIIARSKGLFGLFKSEVKSPLNGTLANISDITGQAIISEEPHPIEIDAYIPGVISKVFDREGVLINSNGTLIQGIIGIGGEKKGNLVVLNDHIELDIKNKDKIIVVKSCLTYDFYQEAFKMGVKGIVCGGIDYSTLSRILGYPLGVAITGTEEVATIVVTDGFGDIMMAPKTFELLKNCDGKFVSINGATQIRAGVLRPEIFIGSGDFIDHDLSFDEESLIISKGSKVRVIREPFFGKIGVVNALPKKLVRMNTETMARTAEIIFNDGSTAIIPRSNLEVILSD
tara:strand:- start:56 stop:1159 length:1104 start_codon:yes stop_codon:yes gene_type:complete